MRESFPTTRHIVRAVYAATLRERQLKYKQIGNRMHVSPARASQLADFGFRLIARYAYEVSLEEANSLPYTSSKGKQLT